MRTVVVVPPEGSRGVYRDNRLWAQQYASVNPQDRKIVALSSNEPDAVIAASRQAIALAGSEGEIVYAVGHGGAGSSASAGQVDFAPQRKFRVTQFVAYYEDSTGTWNGVSIAEMQREAERIAGLPRGRARRREERAWCGQYVEDGCRSARTQVLDLDEIQPHYATLCSLFHASPVRRLNLLTCNVGNAGDFLNELATDLGVTVRAYTERVVSRSYRRDRRQHVRMFLEGDREGQGTNIVRAETELLPGLTSSQYRTGRVFRRRRVTGGRTSRPPPSPE